MALIACPHCGKNVSDSADKCVHCGCALKEAKALKENDKFSLMTEQEQAALKGEYEKIDPSLAIVEKKIKNTMVLVWIFFGLFLLFFMIAGFLFLFQRDLIIAVVALEGVMFIMMIVCGSFFIRNGRLKNREFPVCYEKFCKWLKEQKGIEEKKNYSEKQRMALQRYYEIK